MLGKHLLTQPTFASTVDLNVGSCLIEELGMFLVNDVLLLLLDSCWKCGNFESQSVDRRSCYSISLPVDNR